MTTFVNLPFLVVALVISATVSRSRETAPKKSDVQQHECLRTCVDDASSKKLCRYEFYVSELPSKNSIFEESNERNGEWRRERNFLGVNGRSPGPGIEICLGDTIEVLLYNKLGSQELTLHWHGLRQKGFVHMDGVPMVTQCSILPYGGFRYKIKPESAGTYFYHAHSVSQQGDGVYGSLTVREPGDDPTLERILLLSSRPPTSLTQHTLLYPPTPSELLVNGENQGVVLRVNHGSQYLFRIINANAYNCPILLSTSGHTFRVLAADGNLVQSMTATRAVLFPGERLDVVVEANQPSGKYLVDMSGLQRCRNLRQEAFILYNDAEMDSTIINDREPLKINEYEIADRGYNCHKISRNFVCALDLEATTGMMENNADEVIYIPFDVNAFPSFTDEMTDMKYNVFENRYYPAYLSTKRGDIKIPQINGMSFKYPSSPILSQPENTPEKLICSLERNSIQCNDTPLFCECIQIVEVPARKMIEVVLIDEGFGGNISHTFHVHGYNASILGRGSFDRPITKQEVTLLDRSGKLSRNFVRPPLKDSFVVPNKGYVILRFNTDNLGYWLWESRSTALSPGNLGPGMQFLMMVGSRANLLPVPLDFPTCGNNKGPDLIFDAH